jgi:hypothetical protein
MKRLITTLLMATTTVTATTNTADRVDRITTGLRQSPLFVDPDVSYLLDARQRTTLGEQLKTAGVPIYLVVVSLRSEDESAGDGEYLGSLLHQRPGGNGIYLVADQHGELDSMAYQVPRDTTLDFSLATSDAPLPRKLHYVIDAYAHAPKAAPPDPAKPRTPKLDEDQKSRPPPKPKPKPTTTASRSPCRSAGRRSSPPGPWPGCCGCAAEGPARPWRHCARLPRGVRNRAGGGRRRAARPRRTRPDRDRRVPGREQEGPGHLHRRGPYA